VKNLLMIAKFNKLAILLILGALAAFCAPYRAAAGQVSGANTIYLPLVQQLHNESGIASPVLK